MKPLDIYVGGKKYEYVNNITIDDKNYIAFSDYNNIYIKEYMTYENNFEFFDIDDVTFKLVKEAMKL